MEGWIGEIRKDLRGHRIDSARRDDVGRSRYRQAGFVVEAKCVTQNSTACSRVDEARDGVNTTRRDGPLRGWVINLSRINRPTEGIGFRYRSFVCSASVQTDALGTATLNLTPED